MTDATDVPMICDDCGGTVTGDDSTWSMSHRIYRHEYKSGCMTSLAERLAQVTRERDEARRDATRQLDLRYAANRELVALQRETDTLRTQLAAVMAAAMAWGDKYEIGGAWSTNHALLNAIEALRAQQPTPTEPTP